MGSTQNARQDILGIRHAGYTNMICEPGILSWLDEKFAREIPAKLILKQSSVATSQHLNVPQRFSTMTLGFLEYGRQLAMAVFKEGPYFLICIPFTLTWVSVFSLVNQTYIKQMSNICRANDIHTYSGCQVVICLSTSRWTNVEHMRRTLNIRRTSAAHMSNKGMT